MDAASPEFPEILTLTALLLAPALARAVRAVNAVVRRRSRGSSALTVGSCGLAAALDRRPASLLPMSTTVAEGIYQAVMLVLCVGIASCSRVRRQWRETVYLSAAALTVVPVHALRRLVLGRASRDIVFFLLLATIAFGWLLALRRLRSAARACAESA